MIGMSLCICVVQKDILDMMLYPFIFFTFFEYILHTCMGLKGCYYHNLFIKKRFVYKSTKKPKAVSKVRLMWAFENLIPRIRGGGEDGEKPRILISSKNICVVSNPGV